MKKATPLILLCVFLALSSAHSETVSKASYFRDCVNQKIEQCERKAKLIDSEGENLSCCAENALAQVKFYQQHKEELVQEMMDEQVKEKSYAVNYFLNKTYATSKAEPNKTYATSEAEQE